MIHGFDRPTATRILQATGAVEKQLNSPTLDRMLLPPAPDNALVGIIVEQGPGGEEDFADNRYWVKTAYVEATGDPLGRMEFAENVSTRRAGTVIVTNIAEQLDESHNLQVDAVVAFEWFYDRDQKKRFWMEVGGGGAGIQQFKIDAVRRDHLNCVTWDGEDEGEDIVKVMKPWLLRREPFDMQQRGDIQYEYDSHVSRLARNMDTFEEEYQVIVPQWLDRDAVGPDDVIYAVQGVAGGLNHTREEDADIKWIDVNFDGRFWAEV